MVRWNSPNFLLGGIIKQGGFKVSFWEGVKRLSAEKLLRIIREYDHGKNYYPFEKVAFQVKSKEELSAKVEKYLKDDEDNLFVVEYEGAGAYALTSPLCGAYEGARVAMFAASVVESLYPHHNPMLFPEEKKENEAYEKFITELI